MEKIIFNSAKGDTKIIAEQGLILFEASNCTSYGKLGVKSKKRMSFKARTNTYYAEEWTKKMRIIWMEKIKFMKNIKHRK